MMSEDLPSGLPDGGFVILSDRQGSRKGNGFVIHLVVFLILILCAFNCTITLQFCHIIKTCKFYTLKKLLKMSVLK